MENTLRFQKWGRAVLSLCLALLLAAGNLFPALAETGEMPLLGVTYRTTVSTETMHYSVAYDESVFSADSGIYSHSLCRMSLGLALSAFRHVPGGADQSTNARAFLEAAGFGGFRVDQYGENTDENTIGTVIASKKITSGGEDFTLVAVAVCGGGYQNEWLSNFKVGNPGDKTDLLHHQGFYEAACKVEARLEEYIYGIDGTCKMWISGYSRGAAVSNMTAALVAQDNLIEPGNIFAYTFATPANTIDNEIEDEIYRGLYSIIGMFDIVPKVPLAAWGYKRYGKTMTLPSLETDANYSVFFDRASLWARENLGIAFFRSSFVNYSLEKIVDVLTALFPTRVDYVEKMQLKLMALWREKGNMLAVIGLLSDMYKEASTSQEAWFLDSLLAEDTWQGLVQWSGLGDLDVSGTHSLAENLGREHFPDAYISLIMSSGEELYDDDRGYVRIALWGDGKLTAVAVSGLADSYEYKLDTMTVTSKGVPEKSALDETADNAKVWPLLTFAEGSVLTLPAGEQYCLFLDAGEIGFDNLVIRCFYDQGVQQVESQISLNSNMAEDGWVAFLDTTPEADWSEDVAFYGAEEVMYAERAHSFYQAGLMDLMYITNNTPANNLRTVAIILGTIVAALIITLVLAAVWGLHGRTRRAGIVLIVLLGILYVLVQLSTNFLPAWGGFRAVFKGLASTTVFFFCLLCVLQNKNRRNYLMLAGFVLYIVNDVLIDFHLLWSLIASTLGNVLFTAAFVQGMKKSREQVFAGGAVLLAGAVIIFSFRSAGNVGGHLPEMALALVILAVMTAAAFGQGRLMRLGSILLLMTAAVVFTSIVRGSEWWNYLVSLALYYSGMVVLSLGTLEGGKLPRISARGERRMEKKKPRRSVHKASDAE